MLNVVTFKWHTPGYRGKFTSAHVAMLARMVARYYPHPHRVICYTDDPKGIPPNVDARPLWNDFAKVPNPTGGGRPSCYRRLKLFAPEMQKELEPRFVCLDLDCVITGDLSPLWNRDEPLVMWKAPRNLWPYNGAMFLGSPYCAPEVWTEFDPIRSPRLTSAKGYRGSDQAWFSMILGHRPVWTEQDGVYFLGAIPPYLRNRKPKGARITFTTAATAPWVSSYKWIQDAYS